MNEITGTVLEALNKCLANELMVDVEGLSPQEEELLESVRYQIVRIQQEWETRKEEQKYK